MADAPRRNGEFTMTTVAGGVPCGEHDTDLWEYAGTDSVLFASLLSDCEMRVLAKPLQRIKIVC